MLFGHVVKQDDLVFSLVYLHLLKVYLLNRKEHLRADFTYHASNEGNHFVLFLGEMGFVFEHVSHQLQIDCLNFFVEVINMNQHPEIVNLSLKGSIQTVKVEVLAW